MLMLAAIVALIGKWIVNLLGREHASAGNWRCMIAAAALFFVAATRWPAEMAYCLMNTRPRIKIAALETVVKLSLLGILFGRVGYLPPLLAIVFVHAFCTLYLYFQFGKIPFTFHTELRFDCKREL
ncbi:hypothetical protein HEQ69_03265 [Haematospirillum jordaniae]|uniref:hypothetical protein n=1 Tax=Haematospirillum jordaniae TaxID=1549855 RepID=UPI001432F2C4|nr:hypothetical protein [Haematospirillum jordaniae]NKD44739.1 hypothetical protein [Haematospirillum jordaniae]